MLVKGGQLPLPNLRDLCIPVHFALRKVKGGRGQGLGKSQARERAQGGLRESEGKGRTTRVRGQRERSLAKAYLAGLLLPSNDKT